MSRYIAFSQLYPALVLHQYHIVKNDALRNLIQTKLIHFIGLRPSQIPDQTVWRNFTTYISDGTCVEATHQNVSCQFGELNTCGWTLSDPVNGWKPTVGVSGTGSYGINQTDDYYLVLDGSLSSSSGTSEISTNLISPLRGSFRFSFRAFGYGIAFLRLSVENAEGRKRLWETGDAGREWQLQSIPLCMDLPFRVITVLF